MRGQLLARDAAIHAELASAIARVSSRGRITMHERPHRSSGITTELLGFMAGQCAGPTVWTCDFANELGAVEDENMLIHPRR